MKAIRKLLDSQAHLFESGGKLEHLHAFYEAPDTLLFTPGEVTKGSVHVRDGLDLKRMMITVVVALVPCCLMALYNTGFQANLAISQGAQPLDAWQMDLLLLLMGSPEAAFDPTNVIANLAHGAVWFVPVFAVTGIIGGHIEMAFAVFRKHEVNEGFLVTLFLFPLVLPPTIPLWQVGLGIAFAVILAKEAFGGTGMNVLNVALMGRAFLFFAYPADISGDQPWYAVDGLASGIGSIDGLSGATYLAGAAAGSIDWASSAMAVGGSAWLDAFYGLVPGSMGETSALACLLGAAVLIATGIGSWRTMAGVTVGTVAMVLLLNAVGSETNPAFSMPLMWHLVVGGWAFGTVFMATDPVTSAFTEKGKLIYGFGIGVMVVLVRVINPAYPEGMMLAILFMNMFAPFIDYFFVQANIKRRVARNA
ncbi:MAG: NADH:ubiquinone reductase (Na(+)-transporting) subunit B [Rickettsiales bacterium]|nr:NADH:ubiquinone reductase (Na(+)-transporting) subunit B [Rickettsiales bacterium]